MVRLLQVRLLHNGSGDTRVLEQMLAEVLVHLEDGVRSGLFGGRFGVGAAFAGGRAALPLVFRHREGVCGRHGCGAVRLWARARRWWDGMG